MITLLPPAFLLLFVCREGGFGREEGYREDKRHEFAKLSLQRIRNCVWFSSFAEAFPVFSAGLSICHQYILSSNDLANHWDAFVMNQKSDSSQLSITLASLDSLASHIAKKSSASTAVSASSTVGSRKDSTWYLNLVRVLH